MTKTKKIEEEFISPNKAKICKSPTRTKENLKNFTEKRKNNGATVENFSKFFWYYGPKQSISRILEGFVRSYFA